MQTENEEYRPISPKQPSKNSGWWVSLILTILFVSAFQHYVYNMPYRQFVVRPDGLLHYWQFLERSTMFSWIALGLFIGLIISFTMFALITYRQRQSFIFPVVLGIFAMGMMARGISNLNWHTGFKHVTSVQTETHTYHLMNHWRSDNSYNERLQLLRCEPDGIFCEQLVNSYDMQIVRNTPELTEETVNMEYDPSNHTLTVRVNGQIERVIELDG